MGISSRAIEKYARDNAYLLKDGARLMLALPYDWAKVAPPRTGPKQIIATRMSTEHAM